MALLKRYLISRGIFALLLLLFCPGPSFAKVLVGVIMTGDIPYYTAMHETFATELKNSLPDDEEVQFILQRPFPDPIAWSNAARKLIAIDVDLIVSYGVPATQAVLFEKSNIPVVYAGVYEPESANLSGSNFTGCGYRVPLSSLLRYFKRVKEIDKLQVVYSSTEEDSARQMAELVEMARQQKMDFARMDIRSNGDLKKLRDISGDDAVFVTGSALVHIWLDDILNLLQEKKIPAVDIFPDPSEAGMLITLFQPPEKQGEAAAKLASRVIGGEKAKNIPPVILRETELVFNLLEARNMDITFPIQLIVEATKVIK